MTQNLMAAFSRRLSDNSIEMYIQKLSRWDLTEAAFARATSRMISDLDVFPALSVIYRYMSSANVQVGVKRDDHYWVMFKLGDKSHAERCKNPRNPPVPPTAAIDINLVIPPEEQARFDRPPQDVARQCFRRGYLEAGGKPERMNEFWTDVTAKPTEPRKPLWYEREDEKPEFVPAGRMADGG